MKLRALKNIFIYFVAPIALMTACAQQGAIFSILPTGQSFQGSTQSNKLDILWVVDNSGSMLTKQQNLANSFSNFISLFAQKNYDFHMAIVTTDAYAVGLGGQDSNFQGAPSVITNNTVNYTTVFQNNVVVGATGAADAKALDVINTALSAAKLAGPNTGFLRSDAHLAVIVLSDADDDDSVTSVANTVTFLKSVKPPATDSSTGRTRDMFTVHAVIDDQTNPGPVACIGSEDGVKFRTIANQTGGSLMDICANNFSTGLTNLSQQIAEIISQILLKQTPQVDTISVSVNNSAVPHNATDGWTYVSTGNKIVFHGIYIPNDSASISVTYIPTDIIR